MGDLFEGGGGLFAILAEVGVGGGVCFLFWSRVWARIHCQVLTQSSSSVGGWLSSQSLACFQKHSPCYLSSVAQFDAPSISPIS